MRLELDRAKFRPLPEPARYFPFSHGSYDQKPHLFRLGKDFGNERRDELVLQIDNQAAAYRQQKLRARKSGYKKYVCEFMSQNVEEARYVNQFLARIALSEYPELFYKRESTSGWDLHCSLSGDILSFDARNSFLHAENIGTDAALDYQSGLDALACQFQEDICVLKIGDNMDSLLAGHLCFPNKWAISEKIGKDFLKIHEPVTGFAKSNPNSAKLLHAILRSGPYVRFAWGLSNDNNLDHHPDHARPFQFNAAESELYIRTERQVLLGSPETNLILFFIRTYYEDVRALVNIDGLPLQLASALNSIDEDLLRYKGLKGQREIIINWLKTFY